jgi:hypothetical protein
MPTMRGGQPVRPGPKKASRADATTVRPPRPSSPRGRWFALGLLAGLAVAVVARGEVPATLHDLREWSARALRSLEHHPDRPRPHSEGSAMDPVVAQAPAVARPSATHEAPCPIDPGPGDPCAELLAPFQSKATASLDVPIFPVESLPRVKPHVIARRHHTRAPAALAPPTPADADEDDAKATMPPAPPKSDDVVLPERIPIVAPEQTAENDLR